jgi:5-methylcytosine-specific restriction protein A
LYVIAYCIIPGFTNIRIDRKKRKDGGFTFTFLLEAVGFSNTEKVVREEFQKQEEQLAEESIDRLYNRAKGKSSRKRKTEKTTTTTVYDRDPEISAYVKKRAEGKCDLCGKDAPFKDKKGYPYLEEHHVIRLADGGEDTINNAVALCPNCHREVHIVKSNDTNKTLRNRLIAYSEFENKYNQ